MNYWNATEDALKAFMSSPSKVDEDQKQDAARHWSLLNTHLPVRTQMTSWARASKNGDELSKKLLSNVTDIYPLGETVIFAKNTKFVCIVRSDWYSKGRIPEPAIAQNVALFLTHFAHFKESRKYPLWLTQLDSVHSLTPAFTRQLTAELGLGHFAKVPNHQTLLVLQMRTKDDISVIKPTWAHAHDSFYFDPAPEGVQETPLCGYARCLETGLLKRKEWVVLPETLRNSMELDSIYILPRTVNPLVDVLNIDFSDLVQNTYWQALYQRMSAAEQQQELD